jgi:hypothetical protein
MFSVMKIELNPYNHKNITEFKIVFIDNGYMMLV